MVIPAMPLALDSNRSFDRRHQRALVRYYIDAGAGGLAVGVHTTQFAIRDPAIGLFEPVLRYTADVAEAWCAYRGRTIMKVAGICGRMDQALREADLARELGYHAGLVSLGAYGPEAPPVNTTGPVDDLVAHCRAVAEVLPIIGFYLQPAVGGRLLPYAFWRAFAEIEGVIGVKIAPFNRYQTLDVVRAVHDAGRAGQVIRSAGESLTIALYTGNDDAIVGDLLTPFAFNDALSAAPLRIVGGLLGQWAAWTRKAVVLLEEIHQMVTAGGNIPRDLLTRGAQLTDANGAIFDAAHSFAGCIPGIHEILRRQGLLAGRWCLDPDEDLSPGQLCEIDRVTTAYPHLNDDAFVKENLSQWLD
ncbi:MAG: dihydrodipicolinate synthase family protein [Anaerolineae bacterium]|nr:dihydrodipicolinate synthase family protein [Anaerolineae bacterium]